MLRTFQENAIFIFIPIRILFSTPLFSKQRGWTAWEPLHSSSRSKAEVRRRETQRFRAGWKGAAASLLQKPGVARGR